MTKLSRVGAILIVLGLAIAALSKLAADSDSYARTEAVEKKVNSVIVTKPGHPPAVEVRPDPAAIRAAVKDELKPLATELHTVRDEFKAHQTHSNQSIQNSNIFREKANKSIEKLTKER